ncbi:MULTISPECIES: EamA family transporter RarD [unclassified Pseudomonas]|uniref:EamA family transporter RarD n=1 Tax=unclassified Pseudomonas TaxID=196821 RepID=UPI0011F03C9C|nr:MULTISPECIES: EamA family transporter RarD [unclassified Pseudomonas]KAA0948355.1 EamA family transporter RarD [Pseudomonas sp. ANT_H4]KAA0953154.1 EamA family transporter RarD [Pseudomonas sp. ANT_H14]
MSKGVVLAVSASFLFGVLYFFTSLLEPLNGQQIFGWRMLISLPFMTLLLCLSGDWKWVPLIYKRLRDRPALLPCVVLTSVLVGVQLWIFMWAPLNGHGLDVSLGYFLLPLTMVITGRIVYGERLSYLQKVAAALAAVGVANELYRTGGFSWTTLVVCVGYPLYFVLRRRCGTDNLGGLWLDMMLMIPVALWFVLGAGSISEILAQRPALYWLVPLMGLVSAAAGYSYIMASRLLPFSLFGLLSYAEPVLLVAVSLMLGDSLKPGQWMTYLPIWLAVAVLVLEGLRHLNRLRRSI